MPFCRCSAEPIPLEGRVDDLGVRRAVSEIFAGLRILKGLVTQGIVMFFLLTLTMFPIQKAPRNGRYVLVNRTIGELEFMVGMYLYLDGVLNQLYKLTCNWESFFGFDPIVTMWCSKRQRLNHPQLL